MFYNNFYKENFGYLLSGRIIEQLCDVQPDECGQLRSYADKNNMVRAARTLLSSVTRVLLLADTVVVKQLLVAKDRVSVFFKIKEDNFFYKSILVLFSILSIINHCLTVSLMYLFISLNMANVTGDTSLFKKITFKNHCKLFLI